VGVDGQHAGEEWGEKRVGVSGFLIATSDRIKHRSVTFRGGKRAAENEFTRLAAKYEGTLGPSQAISVRWGENATINEALEAWSHNGWRDLSLTTMRHTTRPTDGVRTARRARNARCRRLS
jgi:hypothetical protein